VNNPLSALVSAGDIRREVKIRGATFTLRLLTMAEVYDLIAAVPVVIPPVTVINGQQVENRRDPAYLSAEAARQRSIRTGSFQRRCRLERCRQRSGRQALVQRQGLSDRHFCLIGRPPIVWRSL
jgi:hypothetical protein